MRSWSADRGSDQRAREASAASSTLGTLGALGALAGAPLDFVVHALEVEGALVERGEGQESGDGSALAVLPPAAAARLGLPEECRLALSPASAGEVGCGLGAPLLERLVAEARGRVPVTAVRLDVDPPRPAHARALAERFALRNGLADVLQISPGTAAYVAASVAYVVEADDRREGLVRVVTAPDGGEPDEALAELLDLTWPAAVIVPDRRGAALARAAGVERVGRWIAARAAVAVEDATRPLCAEVARRHERDHERIAAYFADLAAEARAPRRRADAAMVAAKVAHLAAERDAKLRDLAVRFAVRVTCALAALVVAEVPAALISMRLRRRKASREITLWAPALAGVVDRLACEGCGRPTGRPAACDREMHLLCEGCAPQAQGRIACPACGGR